MSRPSEVIAAGISTIVGAVVLMLDGAGVSVNPKISAGAIALLGYIAAAVTWFISHRQRTGQLASAEDGTVLAPPR